MERACWGPASNDHPQDDKTVVGVALAEAPQVVPTPEAAEEDEKQADDELLNAHTPEDVEGLLNVVLLLSALLLSVSLPLLTTNDRATNVAMDTYFCSLNPGACGRDRLGSVEFGDAAGWGNSKRHMGIISYSILDSAMMSNTFLLLSIIFGVSCYVSMAYAGVKAHRDAFHSWFVVFRWVIFLSFACFVVGIIYFFFCLEYVAYTLFPLYNLDEPFNQTSSSMNTNFVCEDYETAREASGGVPKCAPYYDFLKNIKRSTLSLCCLIPIISLMLGLYINWRLHGLPDCGFSKPKPLQARPSSSVLVRPRSGAAGDAAGSGSDSGQGSGAGSGMGAGLSRRSIIEEAKATLQAFELGLLSDAQKRLGMERLQRMASECGWSAEYVHVAQ